MRYLKPKQNTRCKQTILCKVLKTHVKINEELGKHCYLIQSNIFAIAKIGNHASDQSRLDSTVSTEQTLKQLEINEPVQADAQNILLIEQKKGKRCVHLLLRFE